MKPTILAKNLTRVLMGTTNEQRITPFVVSKYGDDMTIITDSTNESHYETIDFKGNITGNQVECKSRSCEYEDWNDTMVGLNKVEEYEKLIADGKRCWFLFMFVDGTYEWEYTKENYEKNVKDQRARGKEAIRRAPPSYVVDANSSFNPNKLHLYIIIKNLTPVSNICAFLPPDIEATRQKKKALWEAKKKTFKRTKDNYKNNSILTGKCLINIKDF